MGDYDIVAVKNKTLTNSNITQKYYSVEEDKFYWIIFCQRKCDVDEVTSKLIAKGFKAVWIHWDIDQKQRERTLNRFKRGEVKMLIATDVAARWIDVPDLSHVVN